MSNDGVSKSTLTDVSYAGMALVTTGAVGALFTRGPIDEWNVVMTPGPKALNDTMRA